MVFALRRVAVCVVLLWNSQDILWSFTTTLSFTLFIMSSITVWWEPLGYYNIYFITSQPASLMLWTRGATDWNEFRNQEYEAIGIIGNWLKWAIPVAIDTFPGPGWAEPSVMWTVGLPFGGGGGRVWGFSIYFDCRGNSKGIIHSEAIVYRYPHSGICILQNSKARTRKLCYRKDDRAMRAI